MTWGQQEGVQILSLPHTSCMGLEPWSQLPEPPVPYCNVGVRVVPASLGELGLSSGETHHIAGPEQIHFFERR